MGENAAGSIQGGTPADALTAVKKPAAAEERSFRQALVAAVRHLNASGYAGEGREVTYSIDPESRRPVVRLVESQTKEVIAQWPNEYALELAAEHRKTRNSG